MSEYASALVKAEQDTRISRSKMTLARIGDAWSRDGHRGLRFMQGLSTWLKSYTNDNTRRANTFSVLEFFEWFEINRSVNGRKGLIPEPWQVTRDDANAYVAYLRTRQYGLEEERLRKDPTKKLEAAVYAFVKSKPASKFSQIRQVLLDDYRIPRKFVGGRTVLEIEELDAYALDRVLACMVEAKLLTRSPTIEQLRRDPPDDTVDWQRVGIDFRAPPDTFRYSVDTHTTAVGEERSGTILRRVATLSSLWRHYIERGENTEQAQDKLLTFNIWKDAVEREGRIAPAQQKVHRMENTPSMDLWQRLLATTADGSVESVRDRAILVLLFWMGLRVQEMVNLKRRDRVTVNGKEYVRLLRKRSKAALLRLPQPAVQALDELDRKLEDRAQAAEARLSKSADSYEMPRWRRILTNPDAPLLPPTVRWGCNASDVAERQDAPLTRQAVAMMLRRRAVAAGFAPEDMPKVHAHGFRHLAAKAARDVGTPLTTIQAQFGHESLATTSRYVEEHDQDKVMLFPDTMFPSSEPAAGPPSRVTTPSEADFIAQVMAPLREPPKPKATPPKERKRRQTIDTTGYEVEEHPAKPEVVEASVEVEEPPEPVEATPARERLVGIGECTPLEVEGAGSPDYAYGPECWGEHGRDIVGRIASDRVHGTQSYPVAEYDGDPLAHTWVGRSSRLAWWFGPGGNLTVAMPVFSPEQLAGGGNAVPAVYDDGSPVLTETGEDVLGFPYGRVEGLTDDPLGLPVAQLLGRLWERWTLGERDASPTAAAALLEWVTEALRVGAALREQAEADRRSWVSYEDDDVLADEPGEVFLVSRSLRQHREDMIVDWFEKHAAEFRRTRGEPERGISPKLDDRKPVAGQPPDSQRNRQVGVPEWFAEKDPVASLAADDRARLIRWIAKLTGQVQLSDAPAFGRWSRRHLATTILLMRSLDESLDEARGATGERKEQLDLDVRETLATVEDRLRDYGLTGYAQMARKRRAQTAEARSGMSRAEGEEATAQSRGKFYLAVLSRALGEAVAADPTLQAVAMPDRDAVLAPYAQLLAVDWDNQTIAHDDDFKKAFARKFGTHSECVGRRLARYLWELAEAARVDPKGAQARVLRRSDELLAQAAAWTAYRVPCPQDYESELGLMWRDFLEEEKALTAGGARINDLLTRWSETVRDAGKRPEVTVPGEAMSDIEEVFDVDQDLVGEQAEAFARELAASGVGTTMRRNGSRRAMLLNPVELLFAANAAAQLTR